ncbi:MAG: peptide chain release factor 1 [Anaeroplasmataceae bacterium]|jgi:peptide chain release factor 1|nr:peptide chain release factor 1 [Anaeroplasmataceae bacterium]
MIDRLKIMDERYEEINKLLSDPEVVCDIKKLTELSKEQRSLEKTVMLFREQMKLEESLPDLREMKNSSDEEMAEMAQIELEEATNRISQIEEEIKILLLPKDPNDDKNVIVEIRGAAGGDEANIFAGDLFRMYSKYAESKGWKIEVLDAMPSEMGGYSQIQFKVNGEMVYSSLKYESGAHRVQRVPATEAQGRIHTSTSTVLVMPEASEIDFELDMNDIRVDTFCSSGPGGQGVNTTYSAVRVTHIPTGMFVACQTHRSQHENKAAALDLLKTRMYDQIVREKEEQEGAERQSLIGRGDRSEKIRTYNYPQNRVTDHRIGFTINRLDAVIDGKLDLVIEQLINEDQKRKLSSGESIRL